MRVNGTTVRTTVSPSRSDFASLLYGMEQLGDIVGEAINTEMPHYKNLEEH